MDDILKSAWGDLLNENEKLAALLDEKDARIERLEAALQWLMKQPWKSIDKDNMEFQVIVSCYVRDALLAALAGKEGT